MAPFLLGPKALILLDSRSSTRPLVKGTSGPTITNAILCCLQYSTIARLSLMLIGWHSAIEAIASLPGIQNNFSH